MTGDYEQLTRALADSIRLGCEVEAGDSTIAFEPRSDDEVRWLAGWLVSEGWTRSPDWSDNRT